MSRTPIVQSEPMTSAALPAAAVGPSAGSLMSCTQTPLSLCFCSSCLGLVLVHVTTGAVLGLDIEPSTYVAVGLHKGSARQYSSPLKARCCIRGRAI